jgi:hypothetical protein
VEHEPLEPRPEAGRPRRPARPGRRRSGRRAGLVWLLRLVAVLAVFLVGLVIGRALEDAPKPGGEQTIVRTLVPETVGPAGSVVTVTVTAP